VASATCLRRYGAETWEQEGNGVRSFVAMTSERYYREEAMRCRERAACSRDITTKRRWLEVAEECDQLCGAFAASSPCAGPNPTW
jgi:hypothetical protein